MNPCEISYGFVYLSLRFGGGNRTSFCKQLLDLLRHFFEVNQPLRLHDLKVVFGLLQLIRGMFSVIFQRPGAPLLLVDLPVQVRNLGLPQCICFGEEPRQTCCICFNS